VTRSGPKIVPASAENIALAGKSISQGGLVAFPTETVYGLGADATNERSVAQIYATKERPRFNPLIIHCAATRVAAQEVDFNSQADKLAEAFWPGALTLVLPRRRDCAVSLLAGAGLETLAVRVPDHPVAQALIDEAACPIAAPSANRSGTVSPTTAAHVAENLPGVTIILDSGACPLGIESTVIDLTSSSPALLRPGGVTREEIETVIGPLAKMELAGQVSKSPGTQGRHYAPGLPLRLNAGSARPGEALLGFGPGLPKDKANLSPTGDVVEAAANLFALIRDLDRPEFRAIAVMPVPETGLGVAINDRLRRAAAKQGSHREP
jgi:L-threonylcarbamoyladenylate synthase